MADDYLGKRMEDHLSRMHAAHAATTPPRGLVIRWPLRLQATIVGGDRHPLLARRIADVFSQAGVALRQGPRDNASGQGDHLAVLLDPPPEQPMPALEDLPSYSGRTIVVGRGLPHACEEAVHVVVDPDDPGTAGLVAAAVRFSAEPANSALCGLRLDLLKRHSRP